MMNTSDYWHTKTKGTWLKLATRWWEKYDYCEVQVQFEIDAKQVKMQNGLKLMEMTFMKAKPPEWFTKRLNIDAINKETQKWPKIKKA